MNMNSLEQLAPGFESGKRLSFPNHANGIQTVDSGLKYISRTSNLHSPKTVQNSITNSPTVSSKTLHSDVKKYHDDDDNWSLASSTATSVRSKSRVTVPVAPTFKCMERLERRKEFYTKLEEKHKALGARATTQMEASGGNSDAHRGVSSMINSPHSRRHGMNLAAYSILRSPLSTLLEYTGIIRTRSTQSDSDAMLNAGASVGHRDHMHLHLEGSAVSPAANVGSGEGEVSVRIFGAAEHEHDRAGNVLPSPPTVGQPSGQNEPFVRQILRSGSAASALETQVNLRNDSETGGGVPPVNASGDPGAALGAGGNRTDFSSYQRYDIQQAAPWIEQVLPFTLLLLVVFVRQHLQGFVVTIWIAAVMLKSNDFLRKQTALKGEQKVCVLIGIVIFFGLHVVGVYWWYWSDDLLYSLVMLPPQSIPPFWHAIFIIMVNDTLVRQAAMIVKCFLLMHYKNSRGQNYHRQGQMLTLVEYVLLLYRALLPAPVWYCFFLNKEYGSLFSSLMTGLYLTFKLTSIVEKIQSFFTALKAVSCKDIHYGAYATSEQVNAAGDLCAICREKMHVPILLRCKHIFCEDCVSEWFERERTCPLCQALVKPVDLRSFGDGSTSLFFQLF